MHHVFEFFVEFCSSVVTSKTVHFMSIPHPLLHTPSPPTDRRQESSSRSNTTKTMLIKMKINSNNSEPQHLPGFLCAGQALNIVIHFSLMEASGGNIAQQVRCSHSFSLDLLLLLKAEMTVLVALFPPNGSTVSVLWREGSLIYCGIFGQSVNTMNKCQVLSHSSEMYSRRKDVTLILRVFIEVVVFQSTSSVVSLRGTVWSHFSPNSV